MEISTCVKYVGVNDHQVDLFEGQYKVPNGMSYNSYVILDEKIAVMDTVDGFFTEEWLNNVEQVLSGKTPDYLVIQHMEPDHSASIPAFLKKYPNATVVSTAKGFQFMEQFFPEFFAGQGLPAEQRIVAANDGVLELGQHSLHFVYAPMVHWPEVMMTYEATEKILFAADGFGKFGALDADEDWTCEARRYYFNIVGKYGAQVQALLKKAATLDIQTICPLHGPILKENLGYYIGKYMTWSSYEPEDDGVLVAYASIHGNTKKAAEKMKEILEAKGAKKVAITDLSRDDMAEAIEDAFRYDKLVLAAASYDASVFPCMETFLNKLTNKNYQNRKIAIIENGSWAPTAARVMKSYVEKMKKITLCEKTVTIKSAMKDADVTAMEELADELLA